MIPDFESDHSDQIIEDYIEELRKGRDPSIEKFLAQYPEHDTSLRKALLAIQTMEAAMAHRTDTQVAALLALQGFQGTQRFEILGRLGAGGMGAVYDVLDRDTGARVALKLLPRVTPTALSSFKKEFRSFVELADPRLVTLYELYADGDRWFFTMERIEGVSLKQWIQRCKSNEKVSNRISNYAHPSDGTFAEQIRMIFSELALAVSSLHQHGRLHRDLKFSNVMVRSNGSIVLIDFGLASYLQGQANDEDSIISSRQELESGGGAGSLQFMAPEQIDRQILTEACDWYAFGVMLYEALSGVPPFEGSRDAILRVKRSSAHPDPRRRCPDLPDDLCELSMNLMLHDPRTRPSAIEIAKSLSANAYTKSKSQRIHEIVGRRHELAIIRKALDETRSTGKQVSLHIQGDGGIGKTALLRTFLNELQSNARVNLLFGRCRQQESIPFKAIDGVMDALCRLLRQREHQPQSPEVQTDLSVLSMLFPVLQTAKDTSTNFESNASAEEAWEIRRRAINAFRSIITSLAVERPTVIAIDDLHWGDSDSAEFLMSLRDFPIPEPILLIFTYRNGHSTAPCVSAVRNEGKTLRNVSLGPLDSDEAITLARNHLKGIADNEHLAYTAANESKGNPLFVLQYVAHIADGNSRQKHFLSLDDVIWERSRKLAPSALELLEIVCAAGTWLMIDDIVTARAGDTSTKHQLAILRLEHFIITNDSQTECTIEPFHDSIVEVIRQRTGKERRAEASRKLAFALRERRDPRFDLVAGLFEQASDYSQAREYYLKAGRTAKEAFAFDQAVKNFGNAYRLGEIINSNTQASVAELADALGDAGQSARAGETYLEAANWSETKDSFGLRRNAATQLSICGQVDRSKGLFKEILKRYRVSLPPKSWICGLLQLSWQRMRLQLRGLDFVRRSYNQSAIQIAEKVDAVWSVAKGLSTTNTLSAASLHSLALRSALDLGEPSLIARCLAWEAVCQGTCGGRLLTKGYSILARSEELALSHPDDLTNGMTELSRGSLLIHEFRFHPAIQHLDSAESHFLAYRRGAWWELGTVRWLRTVARWHSGRLREMYADTIKYSEEARRRNDDYTLSNMLAVMHPYLCLMHDQSDEAQRVRLEASKVWNHSGFHFQHLALLWSDLQWLLYNRRAIEAHNKFEGQWKSVRRSLVLSNQLIRTMYYDFRATCAIAAASQSFERSHQLRLASRLAQQIVRDNHVASIAFQQRILGGVAQLQGRFADATTHFQLASQRFHLAGMKIHAASVDFALSKLLAGADGDSLREAALEAMASEGVVVPSRFASIHTWNDTA